VLKKGFWVLIGLQILTLLLGGCGPETEDEIYRRVHQRLAGLKSYMCTVDVYVRGNRAPGQFRMKQWYAVPDRYRIEVLEPDQMKGKTTLFDGQRLWMYYPYIDQVFLLEGARPKGDENHFLGFFLEDMMESEQIRYYIDHVEGRKAIVLELPVKGASRYRYTQRLYVDAASCIPIMLELLDAGGQVTTKIGFVGFTFNPDIDPSLFEQDKFTISMAYEDVDSSSLFFGSLEEASEALDFSPLGSDGIPHGYSLDIIQVIEANGRKVLLMSYAGEHDGFSVIQKRAAMDEGYSQIKGEIIMAGNRQAVYSEAGDLRRISWMEGGIVVDITGNASRKTLVKVAEQIR
jgi:outer membrane lipoprotein-sorting protein